MPWCHVAMFHIIRPCLFGYFWHRLMSPACKNYRARHLYMLHAAVCPGPQEAVQLGAES